MASKDALIDALKSAKAKGPKSVKSDSKLTKAMADVEKCAKAKDPGMMDAVKSLMKAVAAAKKANASDKEAVKALDSLEKTASQDIKQRTKLKSIKLSKPS